MPCCSHTCPITHLSSDGLAQCTTAPLHPCALNPCPHLCPPTAHSTLSLLTHLPGQQPLPSLHTVLPTLHTDLLPSHSTLTHNCHTDWALVEHLSPSEPSWPSQPLLASQTLLTYNQTLEGRGRNAPRVFLSVVTLGFFKNGSRGNKSLLTLWGAVLGVNKHDFGPCHSFW